MSALDHTRLDCHEIMMMHPHHCRALISLSRSIGCLVCFSLWERFYVIWSHNYCAVTLFNLQKKNGSRKSQSLVLRLPQAPPLKMNFRRLTRLRTDEISRSAFSHDEKFSVKRKRVVITTFRAHKECQWSRKSSFHAVAHITCALTKKKKTPNTTAQEEFLQLAMNSAARERRKRKKSEINKSQQVIVVIHYVYTIFVYIFFLDVFIITAIRMNSRTLSLIFGESMEFLFYLLRLDAMKQRYARFKREYEKVKFLVDRRQLSTLWWFSFCWIRSRAHKKIFKTSFFISVPSPKKRWNEMSLWTYMDRNGRVVSMFSCYRDITEKGYQL